MLRFTFTLCATLALQHGFAAKLELLGAAEDRIEGEYIVGWHNDEISTQLFEDVKTNWQLHFENEPAHLGELLGLNYLSVSLSDEEVAHVEELPGVDFIHHDMVMKIDQGPPGSQTINRRGLLPLDVLDGEQDLVYNYLNRGEGVDVYVLDTGIDIGHPDWAPNQALFLADCVGARSAGTCNRQNNPGDPQGHGTHVAGISSSPTFGVAKDSTVLNVRVLGANGSGSTAGIIAGIEVAVAEANGRRSARPGVINMSLGGGANRASNNAADAAVRAGIPVIVAAGNDAVDARQASPASAQNVVTVGSTVFNGEVSSFSNSGPALEIFATGSQWESLRANTDGSVVFSGTSMACPTVAGAVAQLLAVNPNLTPAQITNILIQTSRPNITGNALPGSPNRFLTTSDATFFGVNGNGQAPDQTQTQPPPATAPPQAPPVNADNTLSTLGAFGDFANPGAALSRGLMFDVSVAANAGAMLDSITVYSGQRIQGGQAAVLFVTDRGSYRDPPNRREQGEWTIVANQDQQFVVAVNSDQNPVTVGSTNRFNLFRNEIALPTPLQLQSGANQGVYVQMLTNGAGQFFASDPRNLPNGQATSTTMAGVTIREASQVLRRPFGNFRANVFPLVDLNFDGTAPVAAANAAPSTASSAYNDEVSAAQTNDFMRITNENMNTDEFNVANGVFFDLTVDRDAAASLPGVYLEDFEIWLVDALQSDPMQQDPMLRFPVGVEVWTTRNQGSFAGQEGNPGAWRVIGGRENLRQDLAGDWTNPDVTSDMPGLGDAPVIDEDAIVEPIEVAPRPDRYAFGLNMNYPLKTDGSAQGFYVTFTSPDAQMRVYEAMAGMPTDTLASDNVLTLSGGQGASYPFDVRGVRQFAGSVSYGTVARQTDIEGNGASSFAATSLVALIAAAVSLVLVN